MQTIAEQFPHLEDCNTLPKLLQYNARHFSHDIALREKEFGIWQQFTWQDYLNNVRNIALGLAQLGVDKDSIVVLMGDNRPDWLSSELAAHCLGAQSLGIYRDAMEDEVEYLINYTQAQTVILEDEEQVDKFLNLSERCPSVTHIIYCDPRGMRKYDAPNLIPMTQIKEDGEKHHKLNPDEFDQRIDATAPEDVAILCTTSGTTSHPKLSMLQHGSIICHTASYLLVDPKTHKDEYVSVLPMSWIMEQIYVVGKSLVSRMKINFVEEQETTFADLREIGPSFLLLAPRVWEQMAADVHSRMMDASWLKQKIFHLGLKLGLHALEQGNKSLIAEWLLFRALRDRLGLSKLRSAATGGAAMGPDTFKFFIAMGVPLKQLYGQTESMGAYTIHRADEVHLETVGLPFPGTELKIVNPDPEGVGEIYARHDALMLGYFNNENATSETINDDGWMMTGDAGYLDSNKQLVVIDRYKDLAETAQGIRFSPQFIENKLKFSPYVGEAVIIGSQRPYLSAIICIRYSITSKWAEKNRIKFTTYSDLSRRDEVYRLIHNEISTVNKSLPAAQRIKKFLLLYKELDADDGELTRTRKVRRSVVREKYGDIIESIYNGDPQVDVDTTITFQDGSSQRIQTQLVIATTADYQASDEMKPNPVKETSAA